MPCEVSLPFSPMCKGGVAFLSCPSSPLLIEAEIAGIPWGSVKEISQSLGKNVGGWGRLSPWIFWARAHCHPSGLGSGKTLGH